MVAVSVAGVSRAFQEGGRTRDVLKDLSFEVQRGELVALLGRSGSGKSTLLNLIAGIDRPSVGRVAIEGQEISAMDERARTLFRRARVGFVFQFFNLVATLTVEENVRLPLELGGAPATSARAEALRWLQAVGLGDRGAQFPDRLSGGEQQRVAIARALVNAPAVVLADEPTGALDAETGRLVLDLLVDLARRRQATVILVTHSEEVARVADRVLVLSDGGITTRAATGVDGAGSAARAGPR
ncbi:MAG TPA: ABC transporter ATP-binding protein [Polyangia bacterium]|nr:ABC transporter ATP-binding protein [Polyangia bacterium]